MGASLAQGAANMAAHQTGFQRPGFGVYLPRLGGTEQPLPEPHLIKRGDHLDEQHRVADEGPERQAHMDVGHPHQFDQRDKYPHQKDIHHQPGFDPAEQAAERAQGIVVQILVDTPQHQHDGAHVDQRQADQGDTEYGAEKQVALVYQGRDALDKGHLLAYPLGREGHEGKGVGEYEHDERRKPVGDGTQLLLRQMTAQGVTTARTTACLSHLERRGRDQQITLFAGGGIMNVAGVVLV